MPSLDLGPVVGPQGEQGATGAQGIRGEQGLPGPNQVTNSTATPLTGILTGNGSVVGVASIDEVPTADSTGFARSGGTDKAIKGRAPVYGMGKNLLDNPVFVRVDGFPVNQRGQSNYSSGYTIDRWKIVTNGTVNLTSSGISYTRTASGNALAQFMTPSRVTGRSITASLLLGNGTLVSQTADIPASPVAYTYYINKTEENVNLTCYLNGAGLFVFQISTTNDSAVVIQAAKLELGTEQTLCHNEGTAEAPVWVLNEIPDYGEELRKCLQYYVRLDKLYSVAGGNYVRFGIVNAYSATIGMCFIPLPVPLKVRSTAPYIAFSNIQLQNGQASFAVTDIAFRGLTYNGIYLDLTSSGLTTGDMYLLKGDYSTGGALYTDGRLEISVEP